MALRRRQPRADCAILQQSWLRARPIYCLESVPCLDELRRRTNAIPIVFAIVTDPVGQGFVKSLAQPGGNITGFTDFDPAMAGKWLDRFAHLSPPVRKVGALFDPETAPFAAAMLRAIDDNALTLAVRASPVRVYQEATIGEAIATLSREGTLDCWSCRIP